MKMRLSISAVIAAFGLVLAIGFGAVVLTSAYALRELKVGGPLYDKIKLGNDLVADILPPPEYVLEAYLEATLALRNSKNVEAHAKRLAQLKKDYEDRKTFWTGSALEPELKSLLVERSDGEVRKFWQTAEAELIPALRAGDMAKADVAYDRLSDSYTAHRALIDRLVEKANKLNSDMEAAAAAQDRSISAVVWSVAGIVLILIGAGILWGRPLVSAVTNLFKSSSTVEVPKDNGAPLTKPKITDRVGQAPSSDQIAPVAQRVVLYDEDPGDPKGKQYIGSVVWRTEQIKATGTQKADIAVRADIEIPDRKFKMTMSFRRNTDTSLPASHTAELTFILPQDFSGGGVGNVPGILMKSNEQSRGTPLAGLAVKVTDGFFLVGLSNVDADRTRNVQLLKERSWFDVPLVYTNQRRAIIAIEKGAPGERAFNDAFTLWGD
ncbi:MAG: hypothetical protein E6848_22485 [Bradyrhizobium sp.]|nr:hypothetical protein [Bradyrhizobium sp.]